MDRSGWEARLLRDAPCAGVGVDASSLAIVAWSDAATRLFGEGEAVGVSATTRVAGTDAAFWGGLLAGGAARSTANGRTYEWTAVVERDADGRAATASCYAQDVTERVACEAKARLDGTMLRALLDNLEIVVWAMERDGRCTYHEGKAAYSIGSRPGAFVDQNLRDMFGPEASAMFDRVFAGELQYSEGPLAGQHFQNWMIPMRGGAGDVELLVAAALNVSGQQRSEQALRDKLGEIEAQQRTIRELSTPIVEVWDRVLTLPILGIVDEARASEILDGLLHAVTSKRAKFAILDLTGVKEIDTATAGHLIGMVRAIRLLGAEGVITGIHPNIAQTIVNLGVELSKLVVHGTLREALAYCIRRLVGPR